MNTLDGEKITSKIISTFREMRNMEKGNNWNWYNRLEISYDYSQLCVKNWLA